jgi:hypothetical protein
MNIFQWYCDNTFWNNKFPWQFLYICRQYLFRRHRTPEPPHSTAERLQAKAVQGILSALSTPYYHRGNFKSTQKLLKIIVAIFKRGVFGGYLFNSHAQTTA